MDFDSLLAELRSAADDFKQNRTDKSLSTSLFCQRACKAIDKVKAEADTFENQVIGLWVIVGYINELIVQFVDGPFLTELSNKLFQQCARTVLDIQWQQLDEDTPSRQNFQASLASCHDQMVPRGYTRFGLLQSLMDQPWTEPTLSLVMGSEEDNEEEEGLTYIKGQDPEILKLRVELMLQENCDEFALNLCTWCLKHPALENDLSLRRIQVTLLHRLGNEDRLQEECQKIGVEDSIRLIISLQEKEEARELCTVLAQTVLVQNWIKPSNHQSKQKLLHLWIQQQYQVDRDHDNFITSLWAVAKLSPSTEQLLHIIDAVKEQCGDEFIQFYTDLCVFALNVDKVYWEKLVKEGAATGEEAMARKRDMAKVCQKLAAIVAKASPKISFCCALTAFALHPSEDLLQALCESHARKSHAGPTVSQNSVNVKEEEVNIATLYEVERLCGILRPAYLSPDNDFSNLFAMCKQYLRKESGEAARLGLPALMRSQKITTKSTPASSSDVSVQNRNSMMSSLSAAGRQMRENLLLQSAGNIALTQNISGKPMQGLAIRHPAGVAQAQQVKPTSLQQLHQTVQPKPLLTTLVKPQVAGQTSLQVASRPVTSVEVNLVQQMVTKQLSPDVIQILLQLVQSGQISSQQLLQVLSHPGISAQTLHNLVIGAGSQQGSGQKLASQQQLQTQAPQNPPQMQQMQLQQQQQQQQQQLQQQLQQQQQLQLQQQKLPKQLSQLQLPKSQDPPKVGQTFVLQSTIQPQQNVVQQQSMPKTLKIEQHQVQQATGLAHTTLRPRIISGQVVVQPLPATQRPEIVQQPKVQQLQLPQHFLTGVQQIRPTLTSNAGISTLRVTSGGQIQPMHLMTLQQAGAQALSDQHKATPQLVLHNTSHVITHMSGGTITAIREPQQVVHLQSAAPKVNGSSMAVTSLQPSVLSPQMKTSGSAPQGVVTVSATVAPSSTTSYSTDGNRHYLINNLLFTGETQNSTLSIALPDTLPEISVDSVSDTLRALGDPSASSQPRGSKVSAPQAMVGTAGVAPSGQQPSSQAQALPSIATLFAPNRQAQTFPTPAVLNSEENVLKTTVPVTVAASSSIAMVRVQKKTGSDRSPGKGNKRDKESDTKASQLSKEDLTKLLRQAMTLNMDKKQESNTAMGPSHYLHLPGHQVALTSQAKTGVNTVHVQPQPASQLHLHVQTNLQPKTATQTQELLRLQAVPSSACPGPGFNNSNIQQQHANIVLQSQAVQHSHSYCTRPGPLPSNISHLQTTLQNTVPVPRLQTTVVLSSAGSRGGPAGAAPDTTESSHVSSSDVTLVPGSIQSVPFDSQAGHVPISVNVTTSSHLLPSPKVELLMVEHPTTHNITKTLPSYPGYSSTLSAAPIVSVSKVSGAFPPSTTSSVHVLTSVSASNNQLLHEKIQNTFDINSLTPMTAAGAAETMPKTYLNQEHPDLPKESQQQIIQSATGTAANEGAVTTQLNSEGVPSSTVEQGGIVVDNRSGESSIATYRCIICSKAFMTLDALRIHVKQICRPGMHQPSLGDRMALNKAQALEAGLETSTVFQCMRCYELCISESGIREHKLVCSKAPKPKSKPKSRSKPKSPKVLSEEEQATEAKVLELLNKCLGENREKLLNSEASSPKKKQGGDQEGTEDNEAKRKKKLSKKKFPVPTEEKAEEQAENADGAQAAEANLKPKKPKKKPEQGETKEESALLADSGKGLLENRAIDSSLPQTETPKPKPKRKYYPKKKTASANPLPAEGEAKVSEKLSLDNEGKETEKKKNSRKPKPPANLKPRYKEVSGSCGRSFYKCLNCGQTLCSLENFADHWTECIAKNPPPPPKPRRTSKDRKVLLARDHVDPAGKTLNEKKKDTGMSLTSNLPKQLDNASKSTLITTDGHENNDLKQVFPMRNLTEADDNLASHYVKDSFKLSAVEMGSFPKVSRRGSCDLQKIFGDTPVVVAPDDMEVVSELNVETTTEIQESYPQVKDPVVLLEKVDLPERLQCVNIRGKFGSDEMESFESAAFTESSNDTLEFPLPKNTKKQVHGQLRAPIRKKLSKWSEQFSRKKNCNLKGNKSWLKVDSAHSKFNSACIKANSIRKAAVRLPKTSKSSESYCSLCQKNFHKKQILIQHFASKHLRPYTVKKMGDTSSYFCHMCQRIFSQFSLYLSHVPNHSQAITKKMLDMSSEGTVSSPGRSRRIACQRGVLGQSSSRHGRTSPRNIAHSETSNSDLALRDVHKSASKSSNSDASDCSDVSMSTSSQNKSNRKLARAAQKQALSKIFIGTLGIYSQGEVFQDYSKQKTSTDDLEFDNSSNFKRRKKETACDSNRGVETSDGDGGEIPGGDDMDDLWEPVDSDSNLTERSCKVLSEASFDGEKSNIFHTAPEMKDEEQGLTPLLGASITSLPPSSIISPVSSPTSGSTKKPTFLDSYMSYISRRSPEEPLPLNRCRKRYASAGNRQEEPTAISITQRRSSYEVHQAPSTSRAVSPRTTSLRTCQVQLQKVPGQPLNPGSTGVLGKNLYSSIDLRKVYYIGNLEQQLIQKCSVNLGIRMNPSEIERLSKPSSDGTAQTQVDKDFRITQRELLMSKPVIMLEKLNMQDKAVEPAKNATRGSAENMPLKTNSEVESLIPGGDHDLGDSCKQTKVQVNVNVGLFADMSSELVSRPVFLSQNSNLEDQSPKGAVFQAASSLSNEFHAEDTVTISQVTQKEVKPSVDNQTDLVKEVASLETKSENTEQQLGSLANSIYSSARKDAPGLSVIPKDYPEPVLPAETDPDHEVLTLGASESFTIIDQSKEEYLSKTSEVTKKQDIVEESKPVCTEEVQRGTWDMNKIVLETSVASNHDQNLTVMGAQDDLKINKEVNDLCSAELSSLSVVSSVVSGFTDMLDATASTDIHIAVGHNNRELKCVEHGNSHQNEALQKSDNTLPSIKNKLALPPSSVSATASFSNTPESPNVHEDVVRMVDRDSAKVDDLCFAATSEASNSLSSQIAEEVQPVIVVCPDSPAPSDCVDVSSEATDDIPFITESNAKLVADQKVSLELRVSFVSHNDASQFDGSLKQGRSPSNEFLVGVAEDQTVMGTLEGQDPAVSVGNIGEFSLVAYSDSEEDTANGSKLSEDKNSIQVFGKLTSCKKIFDTETPDVNQSNSGGLGIEASEITAVCKKNEDVPEIIDSTVQLFSSGKEQFICEPVLQSDSTPVGTDFLCVSEFEPCAGSDQKAESLEAESSCMDVTVENLVHSDQPGILTNALTRVSSAHPDCLPDLEAEKVEELKTVEDDLLSGVEGHPAKLEMLHNPMQPRESEDLGNIEFGTPALCYKPGLNINRNADTADHFPEDVSDKQDAGNNSISQLVPTVLRECSDMQHCIAEQPETGLGTNVSPALGNLAQQAVKVSEGEGQPGNKIDTALRSGSTDDAVEKEEFVVINFQTTEDKVKDSTSHIAVLAKTLGSGSSFLKTPEIQTNASIGEKECKMSAITDIFSGKHSTDLGFRKLDEEEDALEKSTVSKVAVNSETEIHVSGERADYRYDIAEDDNNVTQKTDVKPHSLSVEYFVLDKSKWKSPSETSLNVDDKTFMSLDAKMPEAPDNHQGKSVTFLNKFSYQQEKQAERENVSNDNNQESCRFEMSGCGDRKDVMEASNKSKATTAAGIEKGRNYDSELHKAGDHVRLLSEIQHSSYPCEHGGMPGDQSVYFENSTSTNSLPDKSTVVSTSSDQSPTDSKSANDLFKSCGEISNSVSVESLGKDNSSSLGIHNGATALGEINSQTSNETKDYHITSQTYGASVSDILVPERSETALSGVCQELAEPHKETSKPSSDGLSGNVTALDEVISIPAVESQDFSLYPNLDADKSREATAVSGDKLSSTAESSGQISLSCQEERNLSASQSHHSILSGNIVSQISGDKLTLMETGSSCSTLTHENVSVSDKNATFSGTVSQPDHLSASNVYSEATDFTESHSAMGSTGNILNPGETETAVKDLNSQLVMSDRILSESDEEVKHLFAVSDYEEEKASVATEMHDLLTLNSSMTKPSKVTEDPDMKGETPTRCCSNLEDLALACLSCRIRVESTTSEKVSRSQKEFNDFASSSLSTSNSTTSLLTTAEGASSVELCTEFDGAINQLKHVDKQETAEDSDLQHTQHTHRLRDSQRQAQALYITSTNSQEVRKDHSRSQIASTSGRVLRSASAGNLTRTKDTAKTVPDDKCAKKHVRASASATPALDDTKKLAAQCSLGSSKTSPNHSSSSPEGSPKHMIRNQAAANMQKRKQTEDSPEQDPDSQLPELCIVTEPRQRRPTFKSNIPEAPSPTHYTVSGESKLSMLPSDDTNIVVSTVMSAHEVKINMLQSGNKKQRSDKSQVSKTYTVAKTQKVELDPCNVAETEESRKPLKGVRSLRQLIHPEPFVWEMDDIEDPSKQARNERSRRAFRKQVSVAPFTWDMDEAEQDASYGSMKHMNTVRGKVGPDASEHRQEGKSISKSPQETEGMFSVSKSQLKQSSGSTSQSASSKEQDACSDLAIEKNFSRNLASKKKGIPLSSSAPITEQSLSTVCHTEIKQKHFITTEQLIPNKRHAVLKPKSGNFDSLTKAELDESIRLRSVITPLRKGSLETHFTMSACDNVLETVSSRECSRTKESEELQGQPNTRSMRKRKFSGTSEIKSNSSPPKRPAEGEGKQRMKLEDAEEGNRKVASQEVDSSGCAKSLRSKDSSPSTDSRTRVHSRNSMVEGTVSGSSIQEKDVSHVADTGSSSRTMQTRGAATHSEIRSVVKSLRSKEVVADVHLCSSAKVGHGTSPTFDADPVKGKVVSSKENSADQDCIRLLRSKESSPILDNHGSSVVNKEKSGFSSAAASARSLRLKKNGSDVDVNIRRTESVAGSDGNSGIEPLVNKEYRIPSADSSLDSSSSGARVHRTRQISGDVSLKAQVKESSFTTFSDSVMNEMWAKESTSVEHRGSVRQPNAEIISPAKALRSGVTRVLLESAGSSSSQLRKDKVEQVTPELLRKDRVDIAQLQAEVHSRRLTAASHVPTPTAQVHSHRRNIQVSGEPLRAMVRRRPKPSLSTTMPITMPIIKKPRTTLSHVHQVEVIRVEPVVPAQSNARRTRSHDRDPSPHTVHTRISAEEYQASSSKKAAAKTTDQKWLMNRCIAPSSRKGVPEQRFPFAFKLARGRTQTK